MNHRVVRALLLLVLLLGSLQASLAEAPPIPGFGGLAKLAEGVYLTVHDTKVTKSPCTEGPRIGLLTIQSEESLQYEPLAVDWTQLRGGRTNDLESICAIEGKPGEFVAVESGYKGNDFARIIHLKATYEDGTAHIEILGAVRFLPQLPDGSTFSDIEGAQTFVRDCTTYLLLAKRGKNDKKARLIWGELDWGHPVFHAKGDVKVETPFKDFCVPGEKRYASDVLILDHQIYISSCNDPGDDGPFTSVVYHVGAIRPDGQFIHLIKTDQSPVIRYKGHKVEALGAPFGERGLWVAGTDDENAGGVVFISAKP